QAMLWRGRLHASSEVHADGATCRDRARLNDAWSREMDAARSARGDNDVISEWRSLERAHIVSQPVGHLHVRTHAAMLGAAIQRRQWHEVFGQLFRLAVAARGSVTGRYPVGNTGGANVSAFAPMPIPDDLQRALDEASGTPSTARGDFSPTETEGLPDVGPVAPLAVDDGGRLGLRIAPVV